MTGPAPVWREPPVGGLARGSGTREPANLADILERILNTGIVVAGDIKVNLLDIELLTIKIRLLVMSVDKARELGIDWWEHDPALSSRHGRLALENEALRQRVSLLESGLADPTRLESGLAAPRAAEGAGGHG